MSETAENRPTFKMHPLEYPKTINGVLYTEIPIRRLTAKQVQDWLEEIRTIKARDPAAKVPDAPIIDAPREVLDELDDDDFFALEEASADFLPRRFRDTQKSDEKSVSHSMSGNPTAP